MQTLSSTQRTLVEVSAGVDRAVSALEAFGAADRKTAETALSWWAHRHTLTSAERAAVLATFPEVAR